MTPNGKGLLKFTNVCRVICPEKKSPANPEGACGWRVDNLPLSIPILGEMPEERALKLIDAMRAHIQKAHPQHFAALQMGSSQFMAFLIALAFQIEDPNALQIVNGLRIQIQMAIPRPMLSDAQLQNILEKSPTPEQALLTVRAILTEMAPVNPPSVSLH